MRHIFRHGPTGHAVKLLERDNAGQLWAEICEAGVLDGKRFPINGKDLEAIPEDSIEWRLFRGGPR